VNASLVTRCRRLGAAPFGADIRLPCSPPRRAVPYDEVSSLPRYWGHKVAMCAGVDERVSRSQNHPHLFFGAMWCLTVGAAAAALKDDLTAVAVVSKAQIERDLAVVYVEAQVAI